MMWGIEQAFRALETMMAVGAVLLIIFVPLGAWKLVEIVIWLCHFVGRHWV